MINIRNSKRTKMQISKKDVKITECGAGKKENLDSFCKIIYLRLYGYQAKASRYRKVLTYLKNRVTTNQKHTIDSQKPKTSEQKHNTKENYQITKGKTERKRKELRGNIKPTGKQGLKWE